VAYSPIIEISDPLIQRRPRYCSEDAFVSGRWRVMISTSSIGLAGLQRHNRSFTFVTIPGTEGGKRPP
jgi:hypothetical protein